MAKWKMFQTTNQNSIFLFHYGWLNTTVDGRAPQLESWNTTNTGQSILLRVNHSKPISDIVSIKAHQ